MRYCKFQAKGGFLSEPGGNQTALSLLSFPSNLGKKMVRVRKKTSSYRYHSLEKPKAGSAADSEFPPEVGEPNESPGHVGEAVRIGLCESNGYRHGPIMGEGSE